MKKTEFNALDLLIEKDKSLETTVKIIKLLRSISDTSTKDLEIDEKIRDVILKHPEFSAKEIAQEIGISLYYMRYAFYKLSKITVEEYKKSLLQ